MRPKRTTRKQGPEASTHPLRLWLRLWLRLRIYLQLRLLPASPRPPAPPRLQTKPPAYEVGLFPEIVAPETSPPHPSAPLSGGESLSVVAATTSLRHNPIPGRSRRVGSRTWQPWKLRQLRHSRLALEMRLRPLSNRRAPHPCKPTPPQSKIESSSPYCKPWSRSKPSSNEVTVNWSAAPIR